MLKFWQKCEKNPAGFGISHFQFFLQQNLMHVDRYAAMYINSYTCCMFTAHLIAIPSDSFGD